MVTITSTKNRDYNSFFSEVIEMMDKEYSTEPKILIATIPEGEGECTLNLYDMNGFDLFRVASMVQYDATRCTVIEEQADMDAVEFEDYLNEQDEYYDDEADETDDGTEEI